MANRLAKETSPYLLQHQENPVDWFPWGEEALQRAKQEDKPILLSVGYSACHWCHVMEHESFENPEIARMMNENFINIKVDREERPDLDQIYQNVAQAMTRSGGWPLTVFLTPDLKPFFGGTYFPPEDRYGRPGFPRVLMALSHAYQNDPSSVQENAEKLTEFISTLESIQPGESAFPKKEDFGSITEELLSYIDWSQGGIGSAPKFPNSMILSYLWRHGTSQNLPQAKEAVLLSLTKMASGGIYDQLGGGFHRYSVDDTWSVPHFEKMLYDNGLLLKLYSEVLLTPGTELSSEHRELFTQVLLDTIQYIEREMTSPEGAFYSAQDADSEGEEGKYFVWDLADLQKVLDPLESQAFALRYGVSQGGNFENGKTVLFLAHGLSDVASQVQKSVPEVQSILNAAKMKLFQAREKRIKPGLDNKVLTGWNGLMVSGLAWTAQAFKQSGYVEASKKAQALAVRAFRFLTENVMDPQTGRLASTFQGGTKKGNGFLDDYAFMGMASLDLARLTDSDSDRKFYLDVCQTWMDRIRGHFKDPQGPGYFFTSDDHEKLIQRPKTIFDQAIPSGTAVALECMSVLAEMDWGQKSQEYFKEVEAELSGLFSSAQKSPQGQGELLCLSWLSSVGPIVVSGPGSESLWTHAHVFRKPGSPEQSHSLLVCHQGTCSIPLGGTELAMQWVLQKIS